jgi:hypothetical protein
VYLLIIYSTANGESCNGATVVNGTHQTIVDANNDTWKIISNNTIYVNGQPAGYSAAVVKLVYWNGTVYQENDSGGWWGWISNGWVGVSDPRLLSDLISAPGCTSSYSTSSPGNLSDRII